jgi:hypothetical protein
LDENREKEDNFFEMHAKTGQEAGNIATTKVQRCNNETGFHWTKIIVYRRKKAQYCVT